MPTVTSPQPPISPGTGEPFSLSNLMPAPAAPAAPVVNIEDIIWRQIQTMQAQGWNLYQRWPGGADFVSTTKPMIPTGGHVVLTIFTLGAWLIVWVILAFAGQDGNQKWCRLTVGDGGEPHYQEIGRPQPVS